MFLSKLTFPLAIASLTVSIRKSIDITNTLRLVVQVPLMSGLIRTEVTFLSASTLNTVEVFISSEL